MAEWQSDRQTDSNQPHHRKGGIFTSTFSDLDSDKFFEIIRALADDLWMSLCKLETGVLFAQINCD